MSLRVETVTVDAHDPEALARWWAELLGSTAVPDDEDWVVDAAGVTLLFGDDPEDKVVKNRVHLDLRPPPDRSRDFGGCKGVGEGTACTRSDMARWS